MLPADIYARYLRLRGEEVLFICATDEHGTTTELAAKEAGLPVAEFCRQQHEVQKDIGERFGLSWDHFGRSSSPQNRELTQHFAARLDAEGYLEERAHQAGVLARRRPLPARPLHRRHLPVLRLRERPRRPVRELHPRPRPHRPARAALGGVGQHRSRGARDQAPLPAPVEARRRGPRLGRGPRRRLAGAHAVHRPQVARRGGAATAASPATSSGACRWSTARASRTRSTTCGSTPRSSTSGPPPSGPTPLPGATGAAGGTRPTTSSTRSSWPRTTCRSTRCRSRAR